MKVEKGMHLSRVEATCETCGGTFERSVAHPYIKTCPACRAAARGAVLEARKVHRRVRCKKCLEMVSGVMPLGQHRCGAEKCLTMWWSLGAGWWRNMDTDDVFRMGTLMGSLKESSFDVVFAGAAAEVSVAQR